MIFKMSRNLLRRINEKTLQPLQIEIRKRVVERILAKKQPLKPYEDEALYEQLIKLYSSPTGYRYDPYSLWQRAFYRANKLLKKSMLQLTDGLFLDAACGDGMLGVAFDSYGYEVVLSDKEDWRDERAKHFEFIESDICNISKYKKRDFDLIVSYNAFEHLEAPDVAFLELLRICKPGGHIYLEFGPLYASPRGMHIYRTIPIPYCQFLFSEEYLDKKLDRLGIFDLGKELQTRQYLNKWRVNDFENLWKSDCVNVIEMKLSQRYEFLDVIMKYPYAFQGRGLTLKDVTTQSISVLLEKK